MDGIKRRETQLKLVETEIIETPTSASYFGFALRHKIATFIYLTSLITFLFPHHAVAAVKSPEPKPGQLIFVIGNKIAYLDVWKLQLNKLYEKEQMNQELTRQLQLNKEVRKYLEKAGSPLANHTSTLLTLTNWKKIVALSNAESGMCKHYPVTKNNCWGVGGSNLWYMGSNLSEGIVSMNHFLNHYPNKSTVKYSQMSFKQMNGLYKQPPGNHWVINNQKVYDDLTAIENSL